MVAMFTQARFALGQTVATPGALEALGGEAGMARAKAFGLLARHAAGDWGIVDAEDKAANDAALVDGSRLFSAYIVDGEKFWIITEWDRSVTTILLPSEY